MGDVESKHTQEACDIITELVEGGARELDIAVASGAVERLLAYSRTVAHYPTAVKEVRKVSSERACAWHGFPHR